MTLPFARHHVAQVVEAVITAGAHTATKYASSKQVVRATRRLVRGKVPKRGNIEIVLTIGRPNYADCRFIKKCERAREPFPVTKVQLKYAPKTKRR